MKVEFSESLKFDFKLKSVLINILVILVIGYATFMIIEQIIIMITAEWNHSIESYCHLDLQDTIRNLSEVNSCGIDSAPIMKRFIYQSILLHLLFIGFALIVKRALQNNPNVREN